MEKKFHLFAVVSFISLVVMLAGCAATTPLSTPLPAAAPSTTQLPPPNPACLAKEAAPPPAVTSKPGYTPLRVSVVDAQGHPVRGLKQSDLVVSSQGNQPPVVYFHENTNGIPTSVVIAIDTSGSMDPKLPDVRAEMGKLIEGLNSCDDVALIAFSGRPFVLQEPTTDHHLVVRRLELLHAMGPTALYDAIDTSVKVLERGKYQGRALILVTDGMDNVSRTSTNDVLAVVTREHVRVYAMRIREPSVSAARGIIAMLTNSDAVDAELFDKISQTGGINFTIPPIDTDQGREFARAIASVVAALNPGYDVGFTARATGTSPTVTVSVANHPDYTVQIIEAPHRSSDSSPANGQTDRN